MLYRQDRKKYIVGAFADNPQTALLQMYTSLFVPVGSPQQGHQ